MKISQLLVANHVYSIGFCTLCMSIACFALVLKQIYDLEAHPELSHDIMTTWSFQIPKHVFSLGLVRVALTTIDITLVL